jgi:micrococcal nuclease
MRRRIPGPRWLRRLRGRLTWVFIALVALPALLDAALGVARPVADGPHACRVVQVVDGDTVRLWCTGAGPIRARLTGYDAPELFSPRCFGEFVAAQRAKWALRRVLWQATDLHMQHAGTDRYSRLLVALYDGPTAVAETMIAGNHGRVYGGGLRDGWCEGDVNAGQTDWRIVSRSGGG